MTITDTHHPHTDADYAFQFICIQKSMTNNQFQIGLQQKKYLLHANFQTKLFVFEGKYFFLDR